MCFSSFRGKSERGFTLIEALVVVSVLSVLAVLSVPAMHEFFIKLKFKNISEDFISAIFKAKNTAVNKNVCTTMCMSINSASISPSCASTGNDWQVGWIVFLNESCNSSITKPLNNQDILAVRVGKDNEFFLKPQASSITRKIHFNARGMNGLSSADEFDLFYGSPSHRYTVAYGVNICLDALGRTRTIPAESSCSGYK